MAHRTYAPEGLAPPFSRYSHAVETTGPGRRLTVSGQVGITADGALPTDIAGQATQVLANLATVLQAAGMGWGDVVMLRVYVLDPSHVPVWREIREATLGDARPASTLVIVAGLASSDWLIEVELEAEVAA